MNVKEFHRYVQQYYSEFPQDLGDGGAPSMKEIETATAIRLLFKIPDFCADSFDREKVRDIIIEMRNQ